jgi:hypothetical protein
VSIKRNVPSVEKPALGNPGCRLPASRFPAMVVLLDLLAAAARPVDTESDE